MSSFKTTFGLLAVSILALTVAEVGASSIARTGRAVMTGPMVRKSRAREQTWIDVRSPNFRVLSNDRRDKAIQVALEFEQIREVFRAALLNAKSDPGQPIVILAVKDEPSIVELLPEVASVRTLDLPKQDSAELNQSSPRALPAGVFRRGADRHFILVRTDLRGTHRYRNIYHEYFHLLASLNLRHIPIWLSEGLAEFWELTLIGDEEVEMGQPDPARIRYLKREGLMPLTRLLGTDTNPHESVRGEVGVFYAQAWALTHYLMVGDDSGERRLKLGRYLERIDRGETAIGAFESEYGDLSAMQDALVHYLDVKKPRTLAMPSPPKPSEEGVSTQSLSAGQADAWKASFLVVGPRYDESLNFLSSALEQDPDSALAHETMALYQLYAGKEDVAKQWFVKAGELGSESFLTYYYWGLANRDADVANRHDVRVKLMEAIRLNPLFAPAYLELARFESEQASSPERVAALARKAVEIQPENPLFWAQLGYILLKIDRIDPARTAARRATALSRTKEHTTISALLNRKLNDYADKTNVPTRDKVESGASDRTLFQKSLATAKRSDEPGPTFRQVTGTLAKTSCRNDGAREYVIHTDTEILTVRSTGDEEFILLGPSPLAEPSTDTSVRAEASPAVYLDCGALGVPVNATFRADSGSTTGILLTLELLKPNAN